MEFSVATKTKVLETMRRLLVLAVIMALFVEADWAQWVRARGLMIWLFLLTWELRIRIESLEDQDGSTT